MITAKLNLSAIDKTKIFEGQKGKYIDVVLIPTPNGQYGDYMVVQSITKEERAAGKKGNILGNGKNIGTGATSASSAPPPPPAGGYSDDLPF